MLLWQSIQCVREKAWKKLIKLILFTILIFVAAYLMVLATVFIAYKTGGDTYSLSFFGIFLFLPLMYGVGTIWLALRIGKESGQKNA
ncbi:MAG TPA: hypothetical protein DIU09_04820 [Hyphomonadaceae bacterium]|nr:hypothetical protein AEM38_12550 [Hyphomonadaceae bacterium UKL13-1]OYU53532.1 MAG: hypothetical protein CFE27_01240 [Alphaproteobacteria bacterium PA1]HCP63895.1 hypothetical protein [Hyphomonadaceae bacterium]